jgi:hypothetical protein
MKKIVFLVLFFMVLTGAFAQTTPVTRNAIQGTWENGSDIIYFSEGGIFILYQNGNFEIDGSYSIGVGTQNQPQTVTFDFGVFDRMYSEFNIQISANELVLSIRRPNQYGTSIARNGTYRRSSFVQSETGNPLAGTTWKSTGEIYRFYRTGEGTLFNYRNEPEFAESWRFRISYVFTNASRTNGNITLWGFDENWSYGTLVAYPFVINGNILRVQYEGGTAEFIRQ